MAMYKPISGRPKDGFPNKKRQAWFYGAPHEYQSSFKLAGTESNKIEALKSQLELHAIVQCICRERGRGLFFYRRPI